MVAVAAAAPDQGPEVAVDRLHHTEGDLVAAVVQDAVDVVVDRPGELLEGRQPLPTEAEQPLDEEARRRSLVGAVALCYWHAERAAAAGGETISLGQIPVFQKELAGIRAAV